MGRDLKICVCVAVATAAIVLAAYAALLAIASATVPQGPQPTTKVIVYDALP